MYPITGHSMQSWAQEILYIVTNSNQKVKILGEDKTKQRWDGNKTKQ